MNGTTVMTAYDALVRAFLIRKYPPPFWLRSASTKDERLLIHLAMSKILRILPDI